MLRPVDLFAVCMLLTALPYVLSRESPFCGRIHCSGASVYCCEDDQGFKRCCAKSLYKESWFWAVVVIGTFLIAAVSFCVCRTCYRYRNASQYTVLRRHQPPNYGSNSHPVVTVSMPPPPPPPMCNSNCRHCDELPAYAAVVDRPPPYSEASSGR